MPTVMRQAELDRLLGHVVKTEAKARGWRSIGGQPFWRHHSLFFDLLISARARQHYLYYSLRMKWYSLDDLLWVILGLPENSQAPMSLRANGAFTLRGQEVLADRIPDCVHSETWLVPKVTEIAGAASSKADEVATNIRTIDDYLTAAEQYHSDLLRRYPNAAVDLWKERLLVAAEKDQFSAALAIARERIATGDGGGFVTEGRTFYQRAADFLQGALLVGRATTDA